jgi:hypothetical protein
VADGADITTWANDAPDDGSGYQNGNMVTVDNFHTNADFPRNPASPSFNAIGFGPNNMPSVSFTTSGAPPNQNVSYLRYDRPETTTMRGDAEFTLFVVAQIDSFVGALGATVVGWANHEVDGGAAYLQLDKGAGVQAGFGGGFGIANTFYQPPGYVGAPKLYTIRKSAGPINTATEIFIDGELRPIDVGASSDMVPDIGLNDYAGNRGFRMGFTGVTVGSEWNPDLQIAEVLFYDVVLSESDRSSVEAYLADKYGLAIIRGGLPGDYNDNGTVDAADYVLWRGGGPLQNEVAEPGTVSAADYDEWRARFGNMSGNGGSLTSVPEPSALLLAVAGLLVVVARLPGGGRGRKNQKVPESSR